MTYGGSLYRFPTLIKGTIICKLDLPHYCLVLTDKNTVCPGRQLPLSYSCVTVNSNRCPAVRAQSGFCLQSEWLLGRAGAGAGNGSRQFESQSTGNNHWVQKSILVIMVGVGSNRDLTAPSRMFLWCKARCGYGFSAVVKHSYLGLGGKTQQWWTQATALHWWKVEGCLAIPQAVEQLLADNKL